MSTPELDRDACREIFVQFVIGCAFNRAIRVADSYLERFPGGREPREELLQLHEWYQALSERDRGLVQCVVREAAFTAVFGFMNLLDGTSGGNPIPGTVSQFAVYLETYEHHRSEPPQLSVRVNDPQEEDLHDLFARTVQEEERWPKSTEYEPRGG